MAILSVAGFASDEQAVGRKVANESYSHQERIKILQEADTCIKTAKTKEEFRACEKKEQGARQGLHAKTKQNRLAEMNQRIDRMPEGKKKEHMRNMSQCMASAKTKEEHKGCRQKYAHEKTTKL